jgi:hypothetical protein
VSNQWWIVEMDRTDRDRADRARHALVLLAQLFAWPGALAQAYALGDAEGEMRRRAAEALRWENP